MYMLGKVGIDVDIRLYIFVKCICGVYGNMT